MFLKEKMIKPNKSDLFPIITIAQQCVILVENLKPSFFIETNSGNLNCGTPLRKHIVIYRI